jgi:hypothetical protein
VIKNPGKKALAGSDIRETPRKLLFGDLPEVRVSLPLIAVGRCDMGRDPPDEPALLFDGHARCLMAATVHPAPAATRSSGLELE